MELPKIQCKHSAQQITTELAIMMGTFPTGEVPILHLGDVVKLAMLGSGLIYGTDVDDKAICTVVFGVGIKDIEPIREQLEAGWRALEMIQGNGRAKHNSIEPFSPEWLADFILAGVAALNGATVEYVLNELPFATLCHLIAANHRVNGGTTSRPYDDNSVLEMFRTIEILREKNNG